MSDTLHAIQIPMAAVTAAAMASNFENPVPVVLHRGGPAVGWVVSALQFDGGLLVEVEWIDEPADIDTMRVHGSRDHVDPTSGMRLGATLVEVLVVPATTTLARTDDPPTGLDDLIAEILARHRDDLAADQSL